MAVTTKFGLPYPVPGDAPTVPAHMQALAEAVDGLWVVGGKRRTANSASISATETIVVDTPTLALAASSAFLVMFAMIAEHSASGTDAVLRIRETSLGGATVADAALPRTDALNWYPGNVSAIYKTTVTENKVFVGTAQRSVGTGTIIAKAFTYLIVARLGPSTLIGDF